MIAVSVVIPTYQRPDLLLTCLSCLERQTMPKGAFEVYVISDGFDAATRDAVLRYGETSELRLYFMHTEDKQGPAAARNIGWRNAQGNLLAFTDDDCAPDPGWLEAFLSAFKKGDSLAFSGSTHVPLPDDLTDFARNTFHLQTAAFITANCACARQALEVTGGFDERFKAAWREDSDLEFSLYKAGFSIQKVSGALVLHPVRTPVPRGISIKEQKKNQYNALLFKKHRRLYRQRIQAKPPMLYYGMLAAGILFLLSISMEWKAMLVLSGAFLFVLYLMIFIRRLRPLPLSSFNLSEMFYTSWIIPFVAVYWRLYGAFKFRVFFL